MADASTIIVCPSCAAKNRVAVPEARLREWLEPHLQRAARPA